MQVSGPADERRPIGRPRRAIPAPGEAALASGLFAWLSVQHLLLWRFLGFGAVALCAGALAFAVLVAVSRRSTGWARDMVGWPTLGRLFALSLVIFVLGGEGRLLYANTDWQVRNAVLRDLVLHPWPFVYSVEGEPLLRLPIGLYMVPALVGKLLDDRAAEVAMLLQNSAMLTIVLALGGGLFATARARLIALVVAIGFSGMDVIGALLTGRPLVGHLEGWAAHAQYSSHITQAFWAPQHGLAGWIGALLYLMWRRGRAPGAAVLAVVPMLGVLSPLAMLGMLPFAAHAGIAVLPERGVAARTIALPGLASMLAIPSLLYLAAAGDTVGGTFGWPRWGDYLVFELLEVGPLLYAAWLVRKDGRDGAVTLGVTAGVLLLAPLGRVGDSVDFIMRASIPALAILSVAIADLFASRQDDPNTRRARIVAGVALAIGLATPANEVLRAFTQPRAPAMLCSYLGVVPGGAATYVAPLARLPDAIRPIAPVRVIPRDPPHCWTSPWPRFVP